MHGLIYGALACPFVPNWATPPTYFVQFGAVQKLNPVILRIKQYRHGIWINHISKQKIINPKNIET